MQIEIMDKGTMVDMCFYAQKILEDIIGMAKDLPGTKTLFIVDNAAALIGEEGCKQFHNKMAQLLYLAKRARPDILAAVSFLCMRVQSATVEDQRKLMRMLSYLQGTVQQILVLWAMEVPSVRAYVDAAYALHNDSRSHTGVIIYVGQTLVYILSNKQKCISKSPTEAELIGLILTCSRNLWSSWYGRKLRCQSYIKIVKR
jgi:hypothetical protein